jgi:hypothetical protein
VASPQKLDSWNDIINWALRNADEPADYNPSSSPVGSSDFADAAVTAGVEVWRDLCGRHPWLCLRKNPPGTFVVFAADTTPFLNVPNVGVNVVCTLSAPYTVPANLGYATGGSLVGFKVRPDGLSAYSYITAHTAGQAQITLDSVQDGMVDPALGITIYKDEYDLNTDLGVFISGIYTIFGYESYLWPEERLRTEYPSPLVAASWPARAFARIGKNRIRFSSYPQQNLRMEYQYCYEPADPLVTDPTGVATLVLDERLRPVFALGVMAKVMLLKSDSRAQLKSQGYEAMVEESWEYEGRLLRPMGSKYSTTVQKGPYG